MASAAAVTLPTESGVLISINCRKTSRAIRWYTAGVCAELAWIVSRLPASNIQIRFIRKAPVFFPFEQSEFFLPQICPEAANGASNARFSWREMKLQQKKSIAVPSAGSKTRQTRAINRLAPGGPRVIPPARLRRLRDH